MQGFQQRNRGEWARGRAADERRLTAIIRVVVVREERFW
jgi:hypothetical protein